MLFLTEIVNSIQQIGTCALLIVNNYILDLIWLTDSIYLFDSNSKDENDNLSSSGTIVLWNIALIGKLCKISLLQCLPDDSILSIAIFESWLHCQCQECHKCLLKKEQLSAKWKKIWIFKKKIMKIQEKKRHAVKMRYDDKKESVKQCIKEKYVKNWTSIIAYKKARYLRQFSFTGMAHTQKPRYQ